jgi:ACS family glucarate transporter-like MFS transporter
LENSARTPEDGLKAELQRALGSGSPFRKPIAMSQPPVELPNIAATRVRYAVLAWFCGLSMITYIDRVCIKQVQGDMQQDLGLSGSQFAWTFSAFALAYALFEIPTGWLGDRIGPKKVLVRIVLCWLFFTALTGLIVGTGLAALVMLLVVRFLFGAGEAGAYPNMARGTRNWFPFAERGRAQGLIWTFGRWGGALAPVLIMAIVLPFEALGLQGWRFGFVGLALLGLIWVWGFLGSFSDQPREHRAVNDAELTIIEGGRPSSPNHAPLSWRTMLSSRTLWILSIMYFCSNAGWSVFITYDTRYLESSLHMSGWQLHVLSGMPLFLGGVGCVLGGLITDRQVRYWGRRWGRTAQGFVAYGLGVAFFVLTIRYTSNYPMVAFACLCLASFAKDLAIAASWATTIDIGHRYSGTVAGFMNSVGNLGTVFAAPMGHWVARRASPDGMTENWTAAIGFYAVMFAIACVCWLFIDPRRVVVYSPRDHERLKAEGVL